MSRVFEFLQKLNGSSDPFSNREAAAESAENILSVLRRPQAGERDPSAAAFDLEQVPTLELKPAPADRVAVYSNPNGLAADRFRLLRLRLRELSKSGKVKSVLITSPVPQDGKSTVAMNLATALAEHHRPPVLLIDADVHRSSVTERLGAASEAGLVNCLTSRMSPLQAVRKVQPLGWYFLPAGHSQGAHPGLLHTDAFAGVMKEVAPYFEWIIIDCSPIVPLTDAASLMKHVDGALLVAKAGATTPKALEDAIHLLGRERVLGVILNNIAGLERKYSRYRRYYSAAESGGPNARQAVASSQALLDFSDR
jgi:protein-tyrosine kinase